MGAREAGARRALVCACWALVLCVLRAEAPDKRAEMSPMPFVLGSRYGRSQPRMIAPRNDRFFMGSRYGKRSEPATPPRALICEYTGVFQLYRCAHSLQEDESRRYQRAGQRGVSAARCAGATKHNLF